jgi:hypothetical protein
LRLLDLNIQKFIFEIIMKKIFLLLLVISTMTNAQTQSEAMVKLKNIKELLEMDLISQKEFDSISQELKNIILNSKVEAEDNRPNGFYIGDNEIIPEKFAESKTDVVGIVLTGGLAGGKTKSYLLGADSKYTLDINKQVLTLKINRDSNSGNISNQQFFSDIQSPNDFALVKLKVDTRKDHRWIVTSSMSLASGYRYQIKKEEYIDFDWERIDDSTYKIYTKCKWGNHAFVYIGTSSFSNNSVYSFKVRDPRAIKVN